MTRGQLHAEVAALRLQLAHCDPGQWGPATRAAIDAALTSLDALHTAMSDDRATRRGR